MISLSSSSETKETLSEAATKIDANLKSEAKKSRIKDVVKKLSQLEISFKSPYTFLNYLEDQGIIDSINVILSIIGRYKEDKYELILPEANKDLIVLSSQLIYIGTKLGEVQGNAVRLEDLKKITRSKYIVEAISNAEESGSKLSHAEADDISRVLSEESYTELNLLTTVEKYLTNLMFNTRFFCDKLDNIAKRIAKEEYGTQ